MKNLKSMFEVSLIIPTYNESKNLEPLLEEIFAFVDRDNIDLEIIFVDDNSPDGTGEVAEGLKQKYPVKVIHRSGKLGLGSAVREGFKLSTRPYLGVMDADLSHDPVIINRLIQGLGEYDITIGSRFEGGSEVENWVWWRKMISLAGVTTTRILTGARDPLSGYFFLRREVIESVPLSTQGYKILFEILIKGKYKKLKEFPFTFRSRKFSTSKLSSKEYLLFFWQVVSYGWYKLVH